MQRHLKGAAMRWRLSVVCGFLFCLTNAVNGCEFDLVNYHPRRKSTVAENLRAGSEKVDPGSAKEEAMVEVKDANEMAAVEGEQVLDGRAKEAENVFSPENPSEPGGCLSAESFICSSDLRRLFILCRNDGTSIARNCYADGMKCDSVKGKCLNHCGGTKKLAASPGDRCLACAEYRCASPESVICPRESCFPNQSVCQTGKQCFSGSCLSRKCAPCHKNTDCGEGTYCQAAEGLCRNL